jgi:hypothetical protein
LNNASFARTAAALVAGAALFPAVSRDASAQSVFNVSTTITASCEVTDAGPTEKLDDASPANLPLNYKPTTDSGVGMETAQDTFRTPGFFALSDGVGRYLSHQLSPARRALEGLVAPMISATARP